MGMEEFVKRTRKLLAKKGLERALKEFDTLTDDDLGDLADLLLVLKGRHNRLVSQMRMSVLSRSEENQEINQITNSLIGLLEDLEDMGDSPNTTVPDDPSPDPGSGQAPDSHKDKILFLASNPTDTGKLRLGAELRDIEEGLKLSENRNSFELESRFAVRAKDLSRAMLEEEPQIIHFSGHGVMLNTEMPDIPGTRSLAWEEMEDLESLESISGGIALEDSEGKAKIVKAEALGGLFELFGENIKCVFLNACYSDAQAEEIIKHVPYVVGMNTAVPDETAISFATGFYDALGAGRDIEFAFKLAKNRIELEGLYGADIPVLRKREE